jgi:uncharacterized Rmd1/YagE family protein
MLRHIFNAYALGGEIDLNRLAIKLGITRKYRWEEPMKLNAVTFDLAAGNDSQWVYLYYFGGVVFINCSDDVIARFLDGIAQHLAVFKEGQRLAFRDDYELRIDPDQKAAITNDYAILHRHDQSYVDIICFVIAKSVALERIEERIDVVFDEVEGLIANLERGVLELPDRDMARLASSILSFKFTSIAHIMVLDKPDITWDNPEADRLYTTLASLFELNQRYLEIKHKSETLLDMTDVFSSMSHARRSARLEWIIIILIAIEILLFGLELFRKH